MDIISIDTKIHQNFDDEIRKIDVYKEKIEEIQNLLSDTAIDDSIKTKLCCKLTEYKSKLDGVKSGDEYGFYLADSYSIIDRYKTLLKTPIKINFFGAATNSEIDEIKKEKEQLVLLFAHVAKKYMQNVVVEQAETQEPTTPQPTADCDLCGSKKTVIQDFSYVCTECGRERDSNTIALSYKDITRTNIIQKGTYEERSHFRDALNQYQGKQNCKIDKKVFDDLEDEFRKHRLIDIKKTGKELFKRIKKEHVMLFLKELGYDKQYENANYIFSEMTGVKCPDISHLEDQLMDDFDTLVNLYTKRFKYEKGIERKSFINIQCVLFQLLIKNKHKCKKEDFNILKTVDRKTFHDEILRELFEEIGWNYTPFF
jgi:hypothetical protein